MGTYQWIGGGGTDKLSWKDKVGADPGCSNHRRIRDASSFLCSEGTAAEARSRSFYLSEHGLRSHFRAPELCRKSCNENNTSPGCAHKN